MELFAFTKEGTRPCGICLASPLAAFKEHQTVAWGWGMHTWQSWASFRPARAPAMGMHMTPQLSLPTAYSLHRETWNFPAPQQWEQRRALHLQPAALLHPRPVELEAAALKISSPHRKGIQHKLSQWFSWVHHKQTFWHCNLHSKCCFGAAQLCWGTTKFPHTVTNPNSWGPNPIAEVCFRGIKNATQDFYLYWVKTGNAVGREYG